MTITIEAAYAMGAKGAEPTESERMLFEAWMRGHCWALSATWKGTQYKSDSEDGGDLDPRAMQTRRLWAAWRDRAALSSVAIAVAELQTRQADERGDQAMRDFRAAKDECDSVKDIHARLVKMVDDGSINGRLYSAGLESEEQIVALEKERDELLSKVVSLETEVAEADALREKLSSILTRSVNAIRGEPEPLHLHSWHDLPELVGGMKATITALEAELAAPKVHSTTEDFKVNLLVPADEYARLKKADAELAAIRNQKEPEEKIPGLGSDESAFIRWAEKEKYDLSCHPMFFVMLDSKTYAARMGWKAAKAYYAAAGAQPVPEGMALVTDSTKQDAARYQWLTADLSTADGRVERNELLSRMSVMSYSAASRDIDAAMLQAAKEPK